ncbi:ABC transporter permease [Rhodococcus sp. OK302]|uniref:ABC transporter permease n=1 Tax=Rhodococcus sp. OK302 TaxID=1882769 RepID=UPI000B93FED2|nr:ABC transporter permease [Rhodococcus sp. OK302]OYD69161.1 putative ABC transport system permease protein [Rhodococcus sp. OK302]
MRGLAIAQARAHAGRYVASIVAVVIAVGYIVATLTLSSTVDASISKSLASQYETTDAVASGPGVSVALLESVPGVRAVAEDVSGSVRVVSAATGAAYGEALSVAPSAELRWEKLAEGVVPTGPGQALVSADSGIPVGADVTVTAANSTDAATSTARVVGLVDLEGSAQRLGGMKVFATPEQVSLWAGESATREFRIAGDGSGTSADLVDRVSSALPAGSTAISGESAIEAAAAQYLGGTDILSTVLLAFGAIAVVVAALVIANTFAVLLAARTQELALLRCIGATAKQVRRSIRAEAAVVGVIASVIGVGLGIGLAWLIGAVATAADVPVPLSTLSVTPVTVLVGLAVGIVMTMVAASAPGRAATRLSPMAALAPLESKPERVQDSVVRRVLGIAALLAGIAMTVLGVSGQQVLPATIGGLLSFLGIAALAGRIVPALVNKAGGLLARAIGPVGGLAAGNAGRNPRRTSATAVALLIGVALTSTLVVGIATVKAAAPGAMDSQFPVDVMVSGSGSAPLPDALGTGIGQVDGVRAVAGLEDADLVLDGHGDLPGYGVDAAQVKDVLRTDISVPGPGQLVLSPSTLTDFGLGAGDTATVRGDRGSINLSVVEGVKGQPALLDRGDLAAAATLPATDAYWVRLDTETDDQALATTDRIIELARQEAPGSDVQGMTEMRSTLDSILDTMLMVVAGLLSVAVLIALIGVGNTMALSVLERRRESGLLRALGMTKKGIRAMLIWEALLVAGVASVIGVVFGLVFGVAGTASVFGIDDIALGAVPWVQLVAITLIGGICGVIASLLPARRAGMVSPVRALAG